MNVQDKKYTQTLNKIIKEHNAIDLYVYCVGMGELLDFSAMEREVDIIDVNLLGMVKTITCIVPHMIAQGGGHFIGLSSLADTLISDQAPSYHASKAGFSNYIEGLALALKAKGVHITNVRFGFVDTKLAKGDSRPFMMSKEKAVSHLLKCIKKKPVRYSAPRIMIPLVKFVNRRLRGRLKKKPVSVKT
jgi:short-subunit dehydrogenase